MLSCGYFLSKILEEEAHTHTHTLSSHAELTLELGPWMALDVIGKENFSLFFTMGEETRLQKQHYSAEVCILRRGKDTQSLSNFNLTLHVIASHWTETYSRSSGYCSRFLGKVSNEDTK